MALDVKNWIGPLAIFQDEGPLGTTYDGRAYRGAHPPDPAALFIVVGAAADAHEQAWRAHGAAVGALPRVVLRAGRATGFEFVPGVSLLEVLALTRETGAELPLEAALYITIHVAEALECLHGQEHVEPFTASGIRVGFDGRVVLFASPWLSEAMESIIGTATIRGSGLPRSAPFQAGFSPEELMGEAVDPRRADVFRLGSLLQHMLDGEHPFSADTPMHALERVHGARREPLRRAVGDALTRELSRALSRETGERHDGPLAFAQALRGALAVDTPAAMPSARAAVGGIACGLFPLAREEQLLFLEELGAADLDLTIPEHAAPLAIDPRHVIVSLHGAPRLYVDRHLVTHGDFREYLDATGHSPPAHFVGRIAELAHEPITMVAPADIAGYAGWCGGRLPTDAEWVRGARCGSLADLTRVWEWTATPMRAGFRVRGGPWRDRDEPGRVDNVSWEDTPAADVGFRLVYDAATRQALYFDAARRT